MNGFSILLGIDYGEAWVGVAIARGPLAEPIKTIETKQALAYIEKLVVEEKVNLIVLGISEGSMADKTKEFGRNLAERTGLPVEYQDETLSSFEARVLTAKAGMAKKKREGKQDHYVAATILQDFMDNSR